LTEVQGRAFEAKGIKPPKDAFGTKVAKKLKFWK